MLKRKLTHLEVHAIAHRLQQAEEVVAGVVEELARMEASAPTLGESEWPSDRNAAIQACALMILGICKTRPQEVWPKEIEGRIRYMLSKLQPQAAEPKGMTVQDMRLLAMRHAANYTEFDDGSLHTIDFGEYGFANFARALLAKGE